jgi:uroporphyrinogen decarboxylase
MTPTPLTPRRRIEALLAGRPADRIPFCPAIYEHKAALIGETPSRLSRDPALFEQALIREVEIYRPDLLVVGCDVYNIEAEAAGCEVRFPETNDVPSIVERAIEPGGDVAKLRVPDPRTDGRMPVCLEAGQRIQARFGRDMIIRGALSAPFSIACELAGAERVLVGLLDDPGWVSDLLAFGADVARAYGRAFVERGLGVILFDSHASPPLVSPALYRRLILPPTASVIRFFRGDLGVPLVPYILGGDTAVLLDALLDTGANNLLCDFRSDLGLFVDRLRDKPVLLRANLDPRFLLAAPAERIRDKVRDVLAIGRRHPGFMLGTGILPYDLSPGKIVAVREALEETA